MNYYIQGNAANADKIKAAFEKLGINVLDFGFADKTVVYCSIGGCGGCVQYLPYSINLMHILHSHPDYKELELELPAQPNFKVHDWVVDGDRVAIIYDLQKNCYVGHDVNRRDFVCRYSDESRLHLWTIADAKDGDVLATDNGWTCIFKAFDGCVFSSYCFMDSEKWFYELGSEVHTPDSRINGNIHPATKEQRTLFFKKMQEAGYQWYAGKKEIRKIVEPKFKVGDWLWNNTLGVHPILVKDYSEQQGYKVEGLGLTYYVQQGVIENEYRLWTINDAKDGDVLSTNGIICIFKKLDKDGYYIISPCVYTVKDGLEVIDDEDDSIGSYGFKPATKEDRELLFRKMKEAGVTWDAEKKELKKIPKHYDIANFKPFDKVLVRDRNDEPWRIAFYGYYNEEAHYSHFVGTCWSKQCIPFNDDTKHLLGTTDVPSEEYINW